jgi:hypothetical protein
MLVAAWCCLASTMALAAGGDAAALVSKLGSGDAREREAAIAALAARGPDAVPAIVDAILPRILREGADEAWLDAVSETLRRIGRPGAAALGAALEKEDRTVGLVIVTVLKQMGRDAEPAAPQLARALGGDAGPGLAAMALEAIGPPAVPHLAAALQAAAGRGRAAAVLGRLGAAGAPEVEQALAGLDPGPRAEALVALGDAVADEARAMALVDAAAPERVAALQKAAAALHARALPLAEAAGAGEPRRRSLEQLVTLYTALGEERAAAPHAERLLALHPHAAGAVTAAAEFHARFGRPDAAEKLHRAWLEHAGDEASCRALAGFLGRPLWDGKGRRQDALAVLEGCAAARRSSAELWQQAAVHAWDWAYREPPADKEARRALVARGLTAVDRALALEPEKVEALLYKGLLLRVQASLEEGARAQQLLEQAKQLQAQALEVKRRRQEAP